MAKVVHYNKGDGRNACRDVISKPKVSKEWAKVTCEWCKKMSGRS